MQESKLLTTPNYLPPLKNLNQRAGETLFFNPALNYFLIFPSSACNCIILFLNSLLKDTIFPFNCVNYCPENFIGSAATNTQWLTENLAHYQSRGAGQGYCHCWACWHRIQTHTHTPGIDWPFLERGSSLSPKTDRASPWITALTDWRPISLSPLTSLSLCQGFPFYVSYSWCFF